MALAYLMYFSNFPFNFSLLFIDKSPNNFLKIKRHIVRIHEWVLNFIDLMLCVGW